MPKIFFSLLLFAACLFGQIVQPGASGGGISPGALVLLGTYDATSASSVSVATRSATGQSGAIFQSDYDEYEIVLHNFVTSATGLTLEMQYSANGGTSWDTGGSNYRTSTHIWSYAGPAYGGVTAGFVQLAPYSGRLLNANALYPYQGKLRLYGPLSTTAYKRISGEFEESDASQTDSQQMNIAGDYFVATAINAFKIFLSSGTFVSGSIRVYGIAH